MKSLLLLPVLLVACGSFEGVVESIPTDASADAPFDGGLDAALDGATEASAADASPDASALRALGESCGGASECADFSGGALCDGTCQWPVSCNALRKDRPVSDGLYTLGVPGQTDTYLAYCDMTNDGGGWTLVLKADGTKGTFGYASRCWGGDATKCSVSNADPAHTLTETRSKAYDHVSAAEVAVEFRNGKRALLAGLTAPLAVEIGRGRATSDAGVIAPWLAMVPNPSLQSKCQKAGLSLEFGSGAQVRIGVLGDDQDCANPDSWIGVGGAKGACAAANSTVGNLACWNGIGKDADVKTFAFVYVR